MSSFTKQTRQAKKGKPNPYLPVNNIKQEIVQFDQGWKDIENNGVKPLLEKINEGMQNLEDEQFFTCKNFAFLYDLIFRMCIQREPYNWSEDLYNKYVLSIQNNLENVVDRFYTHNTETAAQLPDKGFLLFQELIYNKFKQDIVHCILDCIRRERDGENQDRDLLQKAIAVFIELGFKVNREKGIELYFNDFQNELIQSTTSYYHIKQRNLLNEGTCPDYLLKAERYLLEEEDRINSYLHQSSYEQVIYAVQHELLIIPSKELLTKSTGIDFLLLRDQYNDLARMYNLFYKIPQGLEPIAMSFSNHIKNLGFEIMRETQKITSNTLSSDQKDKDKHLFIVKIIELHQKYIWVLKDSFKSSQIFQKKLREAFESFINQENYTARLLAKYINDILKIGSQFVEIDNLDNILDNVVMLYGYIREKDQFERDYQIHLSHRLLTNTSSSEQAEKSMIAKLKTECGYQWTSKLEGMFKDVQMSKDIMRSFQKVCYNSDITISISVNVCTTGFWPSSIITPVNIPVELQPLCTIFKDFYLKGHNGRKLKWRLDQGQSEVKVIFNPNVTKHLICSSYQMCILLLFNQHNSISFGDIATITNIPSDELVTHILSLAHPKIKILIKEPNTKKIENSHSFSLNDKYYNKLFKIKIPVMRSQTADQKEEENEKQLIEQQRRHQIDACIVRTMKGRHVLDHNQLNIEVIQQLSPRFIPTPAMIKQRIAHLIEQEYLERDNENRKLYRYLA